MQFSDIKYDDSGIISFHINAEKTTCYNPFLIALQAMIGDHILDDYQKETGSLIPRYVPIRYIFDTPITPSRERAIDWLIENCTENQNAMCWKYEYPVEYGDIILPAGWISAYAQAYVALAFLAIYHDTHDELYKNYCLGALNCLTSPIDQGGCFYSFSDGSLWFEEIPTSKVTHIFNAHIMALIALAEVKQELGRCDYDNYFSAGVKALIKLSDYMDTGTMSAYDIPDIISAQLLIDLETANKIEIAIEKINIDDGEKKHIINLSDSKCFNIAPNYASGIDWTSELSKDKYRKIIIGRQIRKKPVLGGEIQNTFLNFTDISTKTNKLTLTINYEVNKDIEMLLKKNSSYGYVEIGKHARIILNKRSHQKVIIFKTCELFSDVQIIYHKYHITLLTELNRFLNNIMIRQMIEQFQLYIIKKKLI